MKPFNLGLSPNEGLLCAFYFRREYKSLFLFCYFLFSFILIAYNQNFKWNKIEMEGRFFSLRVPRKPFAMEYFRREKTQFFFT